LRAACKRALGKRVVASSVYARCVLISTSLPPLTSHHHSVVIGDGALSARVGAWVHPNSTVNHDSVNAGQGIRISSGGDRLGHTLVIASSGVGHLGHTQGIAPSVCGDLGHALDNGTGTFGAVRVNSQCCNCYCQNHSNRMWHVEHKRRVICWVCGCGSRSACTTHDAHERVSLCALCRTAASARHQRQGQHRRRRS
jgi:hypothetical protein